MKKFYFFIFIFASIIISKNVAAQSNITGQIIDTANNVGLKAATINLLNAKDSSFLAFTISDNDGTFKFEKLSQGLYFAQISFEGFATTIRKIEVGADKASLNLGKIYMHAKANELDEVVVISVSPVSVKKDTVEFNAAAYTTKPNAVAEDLLKKLPGVEVGTDGSIKAQGEEVKRVLVDGKKFFGSDPKLATQNLPPDVIDKIQVYDAMSDQSAFTGFDDGNRVKTINIVTRKDKRKGYFGKAVVGAGDNGLYNSAANVSRFDNERQITALGQLNNTNKQFFSARDMGGGGGRGGSGGGNGMTKTIAGGLNYKDQLWKGTDGSGSYFYNNMKRDGQTDSKTLYNNSDTARERTQSSGSETHNTEHRFNFNFESDIDTLNKLSIRPDFNYQTSSSSSYASSEMNWLLDKGEQKLNSNISKNSSENENINGSVDLTYKHRFKKRGRAITIGLSVGGGNSKNEGYNFSDVFDYGINKDTITNQYNSRTTKNGTISPTISLTEMVGKNQQVELNYNYNYNYNNSDRYTYDFDSSTMDYTMVNKNLSNLFRNTYSSNRATLSYRVQTEKIQFGLGTGVQFGHTESENLSRDSVISRSYKNIYPTANFRYNIAKSKNLRFNYSGRTSQPSVDQLQPIVDNSDPLNIKSGNPDLKQQFSHSFRLMYNSYNPTNLVNMFLAVNANFTNNSIINRTELLSNGGQSTMPVNANGNYTMSTYFNYGFPLKTPKSNLNFGTNFSHGQSISFAVNRQQKSTDKNYNRSYIFGETIKWTTNLKDNFDMNFSASPSYNINTFTLNNKPTDKYLTMSLATDATYYTHSGWILSSDFAYNYYGARTTSEARSVPLWNAGLAKTFFKKKQGELKFTVYDLLNQNVSINHTVSDYTITDSKTKVLSRYFLVSFTYNFKQFGGKDGNRQHMRDGGGFDRGDFPRGGGGGNWGGGRRG